jgi:hypothetical protein
LRRLLPALVAAALFAVPAAAQNTNDAPNTPPGGSRFKSDWEQEQEKRNPSESEVALPALPKEENLVEFYVSNASTFRFFIDAPSLSVSADRIVRYTLVARSASGVANISYEGMRCPESVYRIYAYGQDGRWIRRESAWQEILPKPTQRWHGELRTRFFCPSRGTILSAAEGLDALRRGGHPMLNYKLGN